MFHQRRMLAGYDGGRGGVEWRYLKGGRARHALPEGDYLSLCGIAPDSNSRHDWLGTGDQREYERVAGLPECAHCTRIVDAPAVSVEVLRDRVRADVHPDAGGPDPVRDGGDRWVVGFTGARTLTLIGEEYVTGALRLVTPSATDFYTGGCTGVDGFVGRTLRCQRPLARHHVIVPGNRSVVDSWWMEASPVYVHLSNMPATSTYRQRNQVLVSHLHELWAFPQFEEEDSRSQRSGTWQTVRMARKAGLLIRLCPLPLGRLADA